MQPHIGHNATGCINYTFLFLFAWADFTLRDAKIMTPPFDNICSSIKKSLCQSSPVWALLVHHVYGGSSGMLSSMSHEESETLGCHDNTQRLNFSTDFLSRQNKYSIHSPHLLVKRIIYTFYVFSEIGENIQKSVTNRSLLHLYIKFLKRWTFVRFK